MFIVSSAGMCTVLVLLCVLHLGNSGFPACSSKYKEECTDKICRTVKKKITTTVYEEECTSPKVRKARETICYRKTIKSCNEKGFEDCRYYTEEACTAKFGKDSCNFKEIENCFYNRRSVTKHRLELQTTGQNCISKWWGQRVCVPIMQIVKVPYTDYEEEKQCPICKILSEDVCFTYTIPVCETDYEALGISPPQDVPKEDDGAASEYGGEQEQAAGDVPPEECKLVPKLKDEFRTEEECKKLKKRQCTQVKRDVNDMSSLSCTSNHFSFYGFNSAPLRLF